MTTSAEKLAKLEQLRKERSAVIQKPTVQASSEQVTTEKPRVRNTAYDSLAGVTIGKRASRKWSDADIKSIPIYDVHQVPAAQVIALGKDLLTQIQNNSVNTVTVDYCLVLAVSIPKPAMTSFEHLLTPPSSDQGTRLDFTQPQAGVSNRSGLTAIEKRTLDATRKNLLTETDEEKRARYEAIIKKMEDQEAGLGTSRTTVVTSETEAAAYGFLAATLLKLYAKSTESYIAGLAQIRNRFAAWYDCPKAVLDAFQPTEAALVSLRAAFARRPEVLSTWTLWVAVNENRTPGLLVTQQGLLNYLACQQFAYPGMHAYTLLIEIHEHTGMKFSDLLVEMDCPATRAGVREALELIRDYEITKDHPKRTTYFRYARNWDPKYFGALQSTECKTLVYVAASVSKKVSAQGANGDPMEIFAIKNLDATIKARLDPVAENMAGKILDQMLMDEMSGASWATKAAAQ
uniref:Nucleoprotein n=1 Tax=Lettuce necrotic yellows virus TaxID=32612 RepID=A0A0U1ZDA4_LNYV|nr:nucleocapsid protein [Lettuce necrotic yellows virus]